jgi:maleate isomerase
MYGWRGRLGVIMPSNNTVVEPEMYSVLPTGLSLHGARVIPREGTTIRDQIFSMAETLPHAIEGLRGKVGVFCYACMATSLLKPPGWYETFAEAGGGVPFLPAGETMVGALRHLGGRRIGVFSPYSDDVAALVPGWFERFRIEVAHSANVPFTPEQVVSQRCEDLYPIIQREFKGKDLDSLAILATDLATFTVIGALEADLGIPVVSSNLALLWSMLGSLGVQGATCPGRLFRTDAAATEVRRTHASR